VRFRIDRPGHVIRMADPEQRERESQEESETKFQQRRDEERNERAREADDVRDATLTERDDGD
jgi:hypothetical protein